MEKMYLQIFNVKTKGAKVLIVLNFVFIIIGLYGITGLYWFEDRLILPQSMIFYIFIIFISSVQVYMNFKNFKYKQYFISWDENEIRFFVPKSKETEIIKIQNIQSITIDSWRIIIKMKDQREKRFNSNLFFIPKRNTVVEYFKTLKNRIENKDLKN